MRLWKKAAIVKPVDPSPDRYGIKQPAYLRSHSAAQSSALLNKYKSFIRTCVHNAVGGKYSGMNREEVRMAFKRCAEAWRSKQKRYSWRTIIAKLRHGEITVRQAVDMGLPQDIANAVVHKARRRGAITPEEQAITALGTMGEYDTDEDLFWE